MIWHHKIYRVVNYSYSTAGNWQGWFVHSWCRFWLQHPLFVMYKAERSLSSAVCLVCSIEGFPPVASWHLTFWHRLKVCIILETVFFFSPVSLLGLLWSLLEAKEAGRARRWCHEHWCLVLVSYLDLKAYKTGVPTVKQDLSSAFSLP